MDNISLFIVVYAHQCVLITTEGGEVAIQDNRQLHWTNLLFFLVNKTFVLQGGFKGFVWEEKNII